MNKYIPYDYLLGKASCFPFVYRVIYMKILEDAPTEVRAKHNDHDVRRLCREACEYGYEHGLKDGLEAQIKCTGMCAEEPEPPQRRRIQR